MNLHEYQSKKILKSFGLPLLKGKSYIDNLENLNQDINDLAGPPWVVKAQIHAGGRGAGYFKNSFNLVIGNCSICYYFNTFSQIIIFIYTSSN